MIYGGRPLLPLRGGYVPELPYGAEVLKLPGGPSSIRRRNVNPITTVSAQYYLSSCFMIAWYKAWYRREALEGGAQFTARLAIGNALFADYTVQFAAAPTIRHDGHRGLLTCSYDVLSVPIAPDDNCDYIALYDQFGNCFTCALEDLQREIQ